MKTPYEGRPIEDGEYPLCQLSQPGYGRVYATNDKNGEILEDMPVIMDTATFNQCFKYVGGHWEQGFTAVVCNHEIIHIY